MAEAMVMVMMIVVVVWGGRGEVEALWMNSLPLGVQGAQEPDNRCLKTLFKKKKKSKITGTKSQIGGVVCKQSHYIIAACAFE